MGVRLNIGKALLKPFLSPAQFDFWSRELGSTVAWDRCHARVIDVVEECENTVSLKLKPNGNFGGFVAGQHVNLTAEINGVRISRCYSITNTPDDKTVDITVRVQPNGLMSTWLANNLKRRAIVELGSVFGELTLSKNIEDPLVLLAAGSGITPMMSLVRQAARSLSSRPITLLYWEKNAASFCFSKELDRINASHSLIRVHKITTQEQVAGLGAGRISSDHIAQFIPELSTSEVYACGSSGFVSAAQELVEPSAKSFNSEAFSLTDSILPPEEEQLFEVELLNSDRKIIVSNQDTLLRALETEGVSVESGCRMGICNTCTCKKRTGVTLHTENGHVNFEQGAAIRLCVSRAAQNLQLEL